MVKTIFEALDFGIKTLDKSNIDSAFIDAQLLLCHILNCDKGYLIVHKNDSLPETKYQEYTELINKRANHMPVKYITEKCEFYSLEFTVNKNVLIPRPDTEIIIDTVLSLIPDDRKLNILDLCSGSGCIGITLATLYKNSSVTLIDISEGAIETAMININTLCPDGRISIEKKDILKDTISGKYDLIVSNPPYINEADYENLEEDVKNYEPEIALVSPVDEYKFYKRIMDVYSANLKSEGYLLFEMGYNQWEFLSSYAKNSGKFSEIKIEKDFSGINRVLCLKKI